MLWPLSNNTQHYLLFLTASENWVDVFTEMSIRTLPWAVTADSKSGLGFFFCIKLFYTHALLHISENEFLLLFYHPFIQFCEILLQLWLKTVVKSRVIRFVSPLDYYQRGGVLHWNNFIKISLLYKYLIKMNNSDYILTFKTAAYFDWKSPS